MTHRVETGENPAYCRMDSPIAPKSTNGGATRVAASRARAMVNTRTILRDGVSSKPRLAPIATFLRD